MTEPTSAPTKWRISDILEALAKDKPQITSTAMRIVAWLRDDNSLGRPAAGALPVDTVIRGHWFISLPAILGLPEVRGGGGLPKASDAADVEVVANVLVAHAIRLNVPQRATS